MKKRKLLIVLFVLCVLSLSAFQVMTPDPDLAKKEGELYSYGMSDDWVNLGNIFADFGTQLKLDAHFLKELRTAGHHFFFQLEGGDTEGQ